MRVCLPAGACCGLASLYTITVTLYYHDLCHTNTKLLNIFVKRNIFDVLTVDNMDVIVKCLGCCQ